MISRVMQGRYLVNNYGFFTYLKERYKKEKVFHILDNINHELDDNKQLNLYKSLILLRKDIDGKDKVGIQTIKTYMNYLNLQEQQLLKEKSIQSDDHIFYMDISKRCADVDLIKRATFLSKVFYYLNGGDYRLLSLNLEFDLLLRKIVLSDQQETIELMDVNLKERLKEASDKLVQYTKKHYSISDDELLIVLFKQYEYHMIKSHEFMKERCFQEALDELVVAQTQLNDLWSKLNNKDGFRVHYQRLIIKNLLITGKAKYFLNQDDGSKILLNALKLYADDIGMDENYFEWFIDTAEFLHKVDQQACLTLLDGLDKHGLNLQRMKLERLKLLTMSKLDQLQTSDVDAFIELYKNLENQNDDADYDFYIFFYNIKKQLNDYESAHIYLELILKKLLLKSHLQQSHHIVNITKAISYKKLINSPNAQQIYEISMQILENSVFRLKNNFNKLKFEDQTNTINTEKTIIIIQSEIDKLNILKNQQEGSNYQGTFNRLEYLDNLFQANYQLRLPMLEILKGLGIEEEEVYNKIDSLRERILDTDILE